jgi:predicted nucleic-acid-binding protein
MLLVDTNIILRYLLNDKADVSLRARTILQNNDSFILAQVVAEVIYVLEGVYSFSRIEIAEAFHKLHSLKTIYFENDDTVFPAIGEYAHGNLDFVDELLFCCHQITGLPVETFDKKLAKKLSNTSI